MGRSQRAASHCSVTQNSDQPQRRQTRIFGAGLTGGALSVREPLR
jgi:hypothetical protein